MFEDMFNKSKETKDFENELDSGIEESDDNQFNLISPISKPNDFDELKRLIDYYEDMEIIIESLGKEQCILQVDENPDDKNSKWYNLDQEYIDLFVHVLEGKMKEIRNILNYN